MNGLPLHPAIVHLPMALAVLIPLAAAGVAWGLWTRRLRPRAWLVVVALQALLVASGVAAMQTGEAEEDRVEQVVPDAALHRHEAYAEQFLWTAGATLGLAALVLLAGRRPAVAGPLAGVVVLATIAVAGLGFRVGHAGGELVYIHGAGSAQATGAAALPVAPGAHEAAGDDWDWRN